MNSLRRALLVAAAVAAAIPVKADTVAGWEVTAAPEADGTCLARRDGGGRYLILAIDTGPKGTRRVVLELGNTAWSFEPRTKLVAPAVIEPNAGDDAASWQALTATSLVTLFNEVDDTIEVLKSARSVGIRFPDGRAQDTVIDMTGFAAALPVLQACRSKMT